MAYSLPEDDPITRGAEEVLAQAVREGDVRPDRVLECVYYSSEPDLWAVVRAVARLDHAARLQVMNYVRTISGPDTSAH